MVEETTSELLAYGNIDVVFEENPYYVIPELGILGTTNFRGDVIKINIDASRDVPNDEIIATLYHEIHHAVRFQTISWKPDVVSQVVAEGLACAFEEEMTGKRPIYANIELKDQHKKLIRKDVCDGSERSSDDWLFGFDDVPRWFGYSYGYQLARNYAKTHDKKLYEIVGVNATDVWARHN